MVDIFIEYAAFHFKYTCVYACVCVCVIPHTVQWMQVLSYILLRGLCWGYLGYCTIHYSTYQWLTNLSLLNTVLYCIQLVWSGSWHHSQTAWAMQKIHKNKYLKTWQRALPPTLRNRERMDVESWEKYDGQILWHATVTLVGQHPGDACIVQRRLQWVKCKARMAFSCIVLCSVSRLAVLNKHVFCILSTSVLQWLFWGWIRLIFMLVYLLEYTAVFFCFVYRVSIKLRIQL